MGELRSLLPAPYPNCPLDVNDPYCIDAIFRPKGTYDDQSQSYWSSSSSASDPNFTWKLFFLVASSAPKSDALHARAVRSGR
jgi:hypothetical protein